MSNNLWYEMQNIAAMHDISNNHALCYLCKFETGSPCDRCSKFEKCKSINIARVIYTSCNEE